jgi:hypothetical protein
MLSRTAAKPPESPGPSTSNSGVVSKSPWSLDLGGAQRSELAARSEALAEELRLKDAQILVLRQLQKSTARDGRIERWRALTTAPAFSGWRRAVATWKAERLLESERGGWAAAAAEAARALEAKDEQLVALADRVARVKANAQAKLAELSSANRQLAAALEQKDQTLMEAEAQAKHLKRNAAAAVSSLPVHILFCVPRRRACFVLSSEAQAKHLKRNAAAAVRSPDTVWLVLWSLNNST